MTEDDCKLIFENVLNYNFWLTVEAMDHADSFSKPSRVLIFVTFIQFAQMQPLRRRISAQLLHLPAILLIWAARSSSLALSSAEFAPDASMASAAAVASHLFAYLRRQISHLP
jgi:hypothetical protein